MNAQVRRVFRQGESARIASRKKPVGGNQFARAPGGGRDRVGTASDRGTGVSEDVTFDPADGRGDPSGKYYEAGEVCRHKPEQGDPVYFSAVEHESGNDGILGGFELEWDSGSDGTNDFAHRWRKFG